MRRYPMQCARLEAAMTNDKRVVVVPFIYKQTKVIGEKNNSENE